MRPDKRAAAVVSGKPSGFYELARAHVAAHGGQWFVVDRTKADQRQQWRAWMAYFAWLDGLTFPRGKKEITFRSLEKFTVPTAWPLEFDASAPPSPLPEPREEPPTPERRRALAAMLRQTVAHLGMPQEPRRVGFERPRSPNDAAIAARYFEARLPELAAEYAANPPAPLGQALQQPSQNSGENSCQIWGGQNG